MSEDSGTGTERTPPAEVSPEDEDEGLGRADPTESPEMMEEREAEAVMAEELGHLQAEFESLNDRHLRLAAEFENYRKRARGEMSESWVRAQADLVRRLLDSLDDLERVGHQDPEQATKESLVEGVDLVYRKLLRALEDAGLELLDPAGERFDPAVMEAMMRVPTEEEEEDDTVSQVLQKGYAFQGHLVRPARVAVRKVE